MSLKFHYHKDLPKPTPLKAEYLRNQVQVLKKIFQPEQKSKEWYEMRENLLTASDWGTILGDNHYAKPESVLLKKCGEETFFPQRALDAMNWGNKYEDVAVSVYEYRNNLKVLEFGCLKHPNISFLGASPDGITEDGVMLEIKCPTSREITGIPPAYYWCQVQGQLEVCELDRCDFLECNFKEYEDETMYLNDSYENDNKLNKFGNEKGIIAEFYKKSEKKYIYKYAPVCVLGVNMEKWKIEIIEQTQNDDLRFYSFSYWYLEIISCVPIYRNQEWFNKAQFELGIFWDYVLKYRALGIDKLKEELNDIKLAKKSEKEEKHPKKRSIKKESDNKNQKKIKDFICLDTPIDIKEFLTKTVDKNESSSDDSETEYTDNEMPLNTDCSFFTII